MSIETVQIDTSQTAGPADPNAPAVQKVYTVMSALFGLVGVASTFGLITTDQAGALNNVGTSVVGLVAAAVAGLAAFRTKRQVKNGTFDPVVLPVQPTISTADQVVAAIPNIVADLQEKANDVQKVRDAVGEVFGNVPVVGGLVDDLLGRIKF